MIYKSTLVCFHAATRSLLAALVLVLGAGPALGQGTMQLSNGQWWNGSAFVPQTMYVVDGQLQTVVSGTVDEEIDLGGGWVIPPLADAHDHGLADGAFEQTSRSLLAQGIFYVQNPNSLKTWTAIAREQAAAPESVDVTYSLGCLTSTGGHPVQLYDQAADQIDGWTAERMRGEAYYQIDDAADLEETWPTIVSAAPDFIKVILERSEEHEQRKGDDGFYGRRGLDPALLPDVVARAHAAGLRVTVHVTSREDFQTAVNAGADEIAHLPLEPLMPEDAAAAAEAGIVVVTTTLSHRPTPGVEDVDALHRENINLLLEHDVALALGTDSHRSVLEEAENLDRLGVDRDVLLRLALRDTARWIFPDRNLGVFEPGVEASFLVLASNPRQDLGALRDIRLAVKQGQMVDLEARELPGVAQALAHTLMRDGLDAALTEYQRLLGEEPDDWDFGEPQLNGLGYFALEHDKPVEAVRIFELNAERFPGSANVWDSLGDGYAALGQTAKARESYERALEIAPSAEHSREKLDALPPE